VISLINPEKEYISMRKALFLAATAAATAMMVSAVPAVASAATAGHKTRHDTTADVLTIHAVGGTDVGQKATLEAGLKTGTSMTFAISIDGISVSIACTKATMSTHLSANPASPGTATMTVSKATVTVADCTVTASQSGLINSLTAATFATGAAATISDATGHPVVITAPQVSFTVSTIIGDVTCSYSATALDGTGANLGSTITFTNQTFGTLLSGSNSACPTTGFTFSAEYGPVKDVSVLKSPHVFVN
jgi:hypothetical protein